MANEQASLNVAMNPGRIRLIQYPSLPSRRQWDTLSHGILLKPPGPFPAIPYSDILEKRLEEIPSSCARSPWVTELPNPRGTRLAIATLKASATPFERLTQARKLASLIGEREPKRVDLLFPGIPENLARQEAEALVIALLARSPLPSFKSGEKPRSLQSIHIHGIKETLPLARWKAEAEGNHLARSLTALPPNHLTPSLYRKRLEAMAEEEGWRMRFIDRKALERQGAGAFLAVAREDPHAGIVHLHAGPRKAPALALVGKGVCFDTGGYHLKSPKGMDRMHEDMQGSAVALGILLALTRLKSPLAVDCWLPLGENLIGPEAYKPHEVVKAANGTTIEIVHTDAEGRMLLADTLAIVSKQKPSLILDFATLTGSCITALGTRMSGVFSNQEALLEKFVSAGRTVGERVWPFPLEDDYGEALDSSVADIKQCLLESEADHILAAFFLKRFVAEGIPWIHVDLASGHHPGGLAHIPTDITGFGVRLALAFLEREGWLYSPG